MAMAETVKMYLDSQEVEYQLVAHPRSHCSKETAAVAHIPDDHIAKAVILKDERGFMMAVIPGSNWIKLRALQQELDRTLELASETEVDNLFKDCQPGAIPPLGLAYDMETVLDEALITLAKVYFEAGDHEHLAQVNGDDFRKLLSGVRHGYFSRSD
jgi:Ala-tRNA(Pro) deacylase